MLRINDVTQIWLGIQGENQARTIEIDVSDWVEDFPDAGFSVWMIAPGGTVPQATGASYDTENQKIVWSPSSTDTYVAGEGEAEIRLSEGNVVKKTKKIRVGISGSVTGGGSTLGPDWQAYINEADRIRGLAVAAQLAAEQAQSMAETAAEETEGAADMASQSATAAAGSATAAETAKGEAEDAQAAAKQAQEAAEQAAQDAQETVQDVVDDITDIKSAINVLKPSATSSDVGRFMKVKSVADGKVTEYEFGSGGGGGKPTIYCWGDSLTEGVGAWIMPPDGHNAYMAYGYPEWVGKSYDVVNLGARSEDLGTIMCRQGADPIVFQTGFTIPAGKDTPVKVGSVTQIYNVSTGTGFTTASGAMVKPCKEVESAGINPCLVAGVEGIFYREIGESALSNEGEYDYYFKRLEDGDAVSVPAETQLETYAMRYYRGGVGIFWVGANGGYSGVMDYIQKIQAMIEYGQYTDYLVIISREVSGSDLETVRAEFTDESGFCHVIVLSDELPYRGYAMAGISYQSVNTSGWTTTDAIKLNAPLLCEYLTGQSGEAQFGTLHYSMWGYKAIGKLVVEKLGQMNLESRSGGGGGGSGGDDSDEDKYGTLLYKLASPRTLNGTNYINTKVKLFEDVDAEWTVAVRWSGVPSCSSGLPYNIFCCALDGTWKGILFRYYSEWGANILVGKGAFNVPDAQNNAYEYHDGSTNVVVIAKKGSTYRAFVNSTNKLYNSDLVYTLDSGDAFDLPLIIGARYNAEGTEVQYKTSIVVEDVRVYDAALEEADAIDLYNELVGDE